MQSLVRTTDPDALISLADAKVQCRVEHTGDDDYITGLVAAAESILDGPNGMVGKAILTQQWTLKRGILMGKERLVIPVAPFASTVSLKYYDTSNVQQTINTASGYVTFANEDQGYIEPETAWPAMYNRPDAIEFIFSAGASAAPKNIVHAAKILIAHWYDNREELSAKQVYEMPFAVRELVNVDRIGWVKS